MLTNYSASGRALSHQMRKRCAASSQKGRATDCLLNAKLKFLKNLKIKSEINREASSKENRERL